MHAHVHHHLQERSSEPMNGSFCLVLANFHSLKYFHILDVSKCRDTQIKQTNKYTYIHIYIYIYIFFVSKNILIFIWPNHECIFKFFKKHQRQHHEKKIFPFKNYTSH
jgi:hypothetical protein